MNIEWRKPSYSNANGGACVEVGETLDSVLVRDTQNRELGHLSFSRPEWAALLKELKSNDL